MTSVATRHEKDVADYCESVRSGSRIASRMERFAVERYLLDLDRPNFYFDQYSAEFACDFFQCMKLTQGELAGQPFVLRPWQKFIVWNLFGFRSRETHLRRFQEALIQVGRGNGKTPFGAGLLFLAGGFHPDAIARGDNYVVATKRDQAKLAFSDIAAILDRCPELAAYCDIRTHVIKVDDPELPGHGSTFQAISSDGKTSDGFRIAVLLKDEYHAWDNTHSCDEFDAKLKTALGKFPQSLVIVITTAGNEQSHKWIAYDRLARMVLDPDSDVQLDSMFAFIAELDEDDDLFEIQNYHKSNPMMEFGIVKQRHIESMIAKAKINPADKRELERFHANRRVQSIAKPFTPVIWAKGGGELPPRPRCLPCGGLDLGANDDLSALGTVWKDGETWRIELDIWVPRGGGRNLSEEPWATWIKSGYLHVTESEWTDFNAIEKRIKERDKEHGWHTLAIDKWNGRQIAINLENAGIKTYLFEQSNKKYNEPCKELEQAAHEGRLLHGGNPVLQWAALNYCTKANVDGHIRPDKESSEEKIDPIVAVIMAISENMFSTPPFVSKYETEDPVVLGAGADGNYEQLTEKDLSDYYY